MAGLRKATRQKARIKMALQGPSGSGKTMSALLIAKGICGDWDKVAVIDTENNSADLYDHLGDYNVLPLSAPYSPEAYIAAIDECLKAGMEVVIIDSASHEWDGIGGIMNIIDGMTGNSFTNWAKVTPRHNAFVNKYLSADCHIVANLRTKQDYVLVEKNGKQVPQKVGMKTITREGMEYEFTLSLELDMKNMANASKDRTGLFMNKPEFVITEATGEMIKGWCDGGLDVETELTKAIDGLMEFDTEEAILAYAQQQHEMVRKDIKFRTAVTNAIKASKSLTNGKS